jgi:hypothetical protein
VLVTNTTKTGQARAKSLFLKEPYLNLFQAVYLPADQKHLIRDFYQKYQPKLLLLMETELWPNLIDQAKNYKVPCLLLNARLSEKSAQGYAKVKGLTRGMLNAMQQLLAQDLATQHRYIDLGIETKKTAQTVIEHTAKYNDAYSTVDKFIEAFWERLPYICIALVVFSIFYLLSKLFKFFVRKAIGERSYSKQNLVLVLNRVGTSAIIFIGFLIAMVIAIPGFTPGQLMSALGIGSVAIGFAFKDIFQNLLSGVLILLGEPFKIGDDIIVSGMEGTVEDIQIRATFLRSPDGRRIVIPNATVYTSAIQI